MQILSGRILQKQENKNVKAIMVNFKRESYLIINIFLAGVIMLVIAYSGFFSPVKDNYPVTCIHEKLTGIQCASCGLSHSFSLILRGKLGEAYQWNPYGMRVFLFFISQLILRITFSVYYLRYDEHRKQLILIDSVGSGIMFLLAFIPFIKWIFLNVF